jgi:plastocyanin
MQMKTAPRTWVGMIGGMVMVLLLASSLFAANHHVSITNFTFSPHGTRAIVGDTITWTNNDAFTHTSTSDNGVWNSGSLTNGQTYSFVFQNAGSFPYHCAVHLSMKDTIFVTPQTGIDNQGPTIPSSFELLQNYPNPFNARTIIRYSLPQAAHVTVDIYNILGNKIENISDMEQDAGMHEVVWDGSTQATGVFFYRISADNQTKTGRMILLK